MTGNQIAFASNIETERHNRETEAEAHRHNVETESVNRQMADIEQAKVEAQARYQDRMATLQSLYNMWYTDWTTASGERKLQIEEKLATIKQNEQQAQQDYYQQVADINRYGNTIKEQANTEAARHNQAAESISAYEAALQDRRIEYENTYWRETVGLREAENAINWLRTSTESEYKLGMLGLERGREPYVRSSLFWQGEKSRSDSYPHIAGTGVIAPHDPDEQKLKSVFNNLSFSDYLDKFRQ